MSGPDALYELHALRVALRSAAGLRDEARLLRDERPDLARSCDRWADDHEASARRMLVSLKARGIALDAETRDLIDQQTGEPAALLNVAFHRAADAITKPMPDRAKSRAMRAMRDLHDAITVLDSQPRVDAVATAPTATVLS